MNLYVAFKGVNNSSNKLVQCLDGEKVFLTNSFVGLRQDIANIKKNYDMIYMFGLDRTLKGTVRVEQSAVKGGCIFSSHMDIEILIRALNANGINTEVNNHPLPSLCNEAYWYMLEKFCCRAVFIHIPSLKYIDKEFITKMATALSLFK